MGAVAGFGVRRRRAGSDFPALDRVQMGQPELTACHLWRPRPRGRGRSLSFYGAGEGRLQRLAGVSRGSVRHFTGLPPDRSNSLQGQDGAGRRYVSAATLAVLQEDANRPWLRRQAERAGLYGLFGQTDRGIAEEFNFLGAHHALGSRRCRGAEMWRIRPVTGIWAKGPRVIALPGSRSAGPMVQLAVSDRGSRPGARVLAGPIRCGD